MTTALRLLLAASLAAGEGRDEETVRAEIALEFCLESLRPEADSALPLPAPGGTPEVDGLLDEPFWREASVYLFETAGDSAFRGPEGWRISIARGEGDLYFAGERRGPMASAEVLSLDRSWRERIVLRLEPGGKSRARLESAVSTEALEGAGGGSAAGFAARVGPEGATWELRIPAESAPLAFDPWPWEPDRPLSLRFTWSRGDPAAVRVSPELRLEPDTVAVRALGWRLTPEGALEATHELLNLGKENVLVELSLRERIELAPLARRAVGTSVSPRPGAHAAGFEFPVAGRAVPYRSALPTLIPEGGGLAAGIDRALELAAANLKRLAEPDAALEAELVRLRRALGGARGSPRALEGVYLEARLLRRRSFLAGLPRALDEFLVAKRHHFRTGPYYSTYLHDMPGGNLAVVSLRTGGERELLEMPPGGSVRDPALSFDGRRVVLSLRQRGSGANLHVLELASGDLRRLTGGQDHDLEPCWLPGGEVLFTSTRARSRSPINAADNLCLHAVREDGTGLRRVSFNYLSDFTPSVLPDGRVVFLRWVHEDKPGNFINALWTMSPDGSRLAGFFGLNHPGVLLEPRAVPGTPLVACVDSGPFGHWREPQAGDIGVFDPTADRNRFAYTIGAARGGFKNPFPVGAEAFLAAYGAPDTRWGIYLADRSGNLEPVFRDLELSAFNPIPLRPEPEPVRLAPGLHFGGQRGEEGAPATATVVMQDVYQGLPGVERGAVKRLRIVSVPDRPLVELRGYLDQTAPVAVLNRMVRRVLGTVPVHADGSAHFAVPAETSLFFQALDGEGLAVQTMRDTIAFGSGEHRSCIGCHEPRSDAPPPVARERLMALDGPAAAIEPEPGPAALSFPRDIQPILDRRCVPCHDARDPKGLVVLSGDLTPFFDLAYETLTRGGGNANHQSWGESPRAGQRPLAPAARYVTEPLPPRSTGARASRLFELLEAKHAGVALEGAERALLARWIDVNLPYYDDWTTGRQGSERRLLSAGAERTIGGVLRARCRGCHAPPDLFRGAVLSLTRPVLSPLLRAPLWRAAGGFGRCAGGVFEDARDAGYRAILEALEADRARLASLRGAGREPAPPVPAAVLEPSLPEGSELPPRSPAFVADPSAVCGSCHPRHFREWAASVHAHAFRPPPHLPDPPREGPQGIPDRACAGCHGSLDRLLGRSFPPDHPLDLGHGAELVVSCTTCHQIADEHARAGLPAGGCLPEGFVRPSIERPFHRTKSMALVQSPETCGPCHESRTAAGVALERTYSQYLATVFPARGISCAACHMRPFSGPMVPGGPLRYSLHRHDLIGVDTTAEAVPEAGPQIERVLAFLRPSLLVSPRAPAEVEAGGELVVEVDLKNTGAGHNFPAGPIGERRMWVEVRARSRSPEGGERLLLHSGAAGPDGEPLPGPELVELADRFVDRLGQEVMSSEDAAGVEERSLRSMETRRARYPIPLRGAGPGDEVLIEVRVRFRAARAALLRERGLQGVAERYPVLELFRGEAGPVRVVERAVPEGVVRVPEDRAGIALAIEAAPPGGTVLVGPGVHEPTGPIRFTGRGIALRGREGRARTVLRLKGAVAFSGRGERADTIAGFTLEGGRIVCEGAQAVVEDVVLSSSSTDGDGGAIHARGSRLWIRDSQVLRNSAGGRGGGLASFGSEVHVARTLFAGNSAAQGGAMASDGGLTLEDVTVQGNWAERGGGASLGGAAPAPEAKVLRSRFLGNLARTGAGLDLEGPIQVAFRETLVAGNLASERGGGIAFRGGAAPRLDRVTVADNSARSGGGVVGDRQSRAAVRNSIVWANRPPAVTGTVEHSVVDDPRHQGGSNLAVLPLFEAAEGEWVGCDEPRAADCVPLGEEGPGRGAVAWRRWVPGDYRLVNLSQAIDAGDPRAPPEPDGTRLDLGAFHCPQPARSFIRGDLTGDGAVALDDLFLLARHLKDADLLPCADAGDLDDGGELDGLDLVWAAALGLGLGPPPPAPFPACGPDPVLDDGLGCFKSLCEK